MNNQLRKFVGVAILLSAAAASGQISNQVQVTVPFSFMAGGHLSPAGEYTAEINWSQGVLTLSSKQSKLFMLTTTTAYGNRQSYLRFQRYADTWFLQEVAFDGMAENVPIDKRQREAMIAEKSSGGGSLIADIAIH